MCLQEWFDSGYQYKWQIKLVMQEAYLKLNKLVNHNGEILRCLTKEIQDACTTGDQNVYKKAVFEYKEALEVG